MPPRSTRPTLVQVARHAGVSTSTVSRHLNGQLVVAPDTAARIDEAVLALRYRPDLTARGLATGRSRTVGVVTPQVGSAFFTQAARGVEDGLSALGYSALFVNGHWSPTEESARLAGLAGRGVDGLVLIYGTLDADEIVRLAHGIPVVQIGRDITAAGVYSLWLDQTAGARLVVRHLVELGHRRIAHIAGPDALPDSIERLNGYRQALAEAGIACDERLVVRGSYLSDDGAAAMQALLDRGLPFSAVFAANDETAYGALLALHRRGLRVPHDLSLVGFDDLPHSAFVVPPLTSVRQPLDVLGRDAAAAVVALIEGRRPGGHGGRLTLVPRESVRAVPVA